MRRLLKKLALLLYLPVVTLVLLEATVRLWGYSEHYLYDPIYMPFRESSDLPYVHKPNLENARARGFSVISTDSLGLRATSPGVGYRNKADDEFRIAIAGDSITFGEGVKKTEDTFPQVLENVLNRKQSVFRVRALNFGVSAYSVREMAATLRHRMVPLSPDLVFMAIVPQDLDVSRTGAVDRWGYTFNAARSGFMDKDSRIKRLLRRVRLTYVLRDLRYRLWVREAPGEFEVPASYTCVKQFAETSDSLGLPYAIILLPSFDQSSSEKLGSRLREDELKLVDLSFLTQKFSPVEFRASRFDEHPSAAVHRRMGEELAAGVLKEGWLRRRGGAR